MTAELRVRGPGSLKLHRRPGKNLRLMDNDRLLLTGTVEWKYPEHRPSIVRIVVSDPIDDSTDGFGDGSYWWAEWGLQLEGSLDLTLKMCPKPFELPEKIPPTITTLFHISASVCTTN